MYARHLPSVLAVVFCVCSPAQADVSDYLTPDGKLKHPLEVKQVQGGFAGFTGVVFVVQADGKWTKGSVFNQEVKPLASGQLNGDQLKGLAAELDKYKLLTLKSEGRVMVNPSVVSVTFGKLKAELNQMGGAGVPKPDDKTNAGRFGGVWSAVEKLTEK